MNQRPDQRAVTQQEIQDDFLGHVYTMVGYWAREERVRSVRGRLEGLVHSIFCYLDGVSGSSPCPFEIVNTLSAADLAMELEDNPDHRHYPVQELPDDIITVHGGQMLHEMWGKFMRSVDRAEKGASDESTT
jgi:hypothetical protein